MREDGSCFLKSGQNERVRAGLGVLGTLWATLRPNRLGQAIKSKRSGFYIIDGKKTYHYILIDPNLIYITKIWKTIYYNKS